MLQANAFFLFLHLCLLLDRSKKRFKGKGFIEFVSMLAMAVPGTVLGIGYIRGYANGLFRTGIMSGLYGTGLIPVGRLRTINTIIRISPVP